MVCIHSVTSKGSVVFCDWMSWSVCLLSDGVCEFCCGGVIYSVRAMLSE